MSMRTASESAADAATAAALAQDGNGVALIIDDLAGIFNRLLGGYPHTRHKAFDKNTVVAKVVFSFGLTCGERAFNFFWI